MEFQQEHGQTLSSAHHLLLRYRVSNVVADILQAWELYYRVFRSINKKLTQLTQLELQSVSPALLTAKNLELAVPGTYAVNQEVVQIQGFAPSLDVISSKQRPRKITLYGSNGRQYRFLLKGHEDLRQDERVMQLFGLVNTLLSNNPETSKRDLLIGRYSVTPLSHEAGVVGWVPACDTLHQLIRDHRESRNILVNIEHRLMLQMAPKYEFLTLLQKVEVLQHALDNTTGTDLAKVLWFKSRNSEMWLYRRTNYTRSLAVMSMVGYVLGLGDRHPSNLALHRRSGKILHIDFGDCFEVAMTREHYPERIPFRLTRMLIAAMEVSGIEGNYRSTCDSVMKVLREHRDSVMAMLEAFVHDPLINWRLLKPSEASGTVGTVQGDAGNASPFRARAAAVPKPPVLPTDVDASDLPKLKAMTMKFSVHNREGAGSHRNRGERDRGLVKTLGAEGTSVAAEALNERAVAVIRRVNAKLTGRDFGENETFEVPDQVQRLILKATSVENLCQGYIGWCPFW